MLNCDMTPQSYLLKSYINEISVKTCHIDNVHNIIIHGLKNFDMMDLM